MVVNALGDSSEYVKVGVVQLKLCSGDRLQLCRDGLTDLVDDETICQVLIDCRESAEACRRLVDLALAGGGRDNVTVVVASYTFPA